MKKLPILGLLALSTLLGNNMAKAATNDNIHTTNKTELNHVNADGKKKLKNEKKKLAKEERKLEDKQRDLNKAIKLEKEKEKLKKRQAKVDKKIKKLK
jgi:adenosylmethionine-8-amino-7-oxononanoate aminotransferase